MRVESGDGDAGRARLAGFNDGADDVDGSTRVVKIIHDRCAFVTLPPDVVSATLRSSKRSGGDFPRHATLDFGRASTKGDGSGVVHVAWAGGVTPGGEMTRDIGVPHALASALGIRDGEEAIFSFGRGGNLPTAESVTVAPLSADDWEAVLAQADAIEANLLSQIGLAALGQAVPFYAGGGGKPLFLRVLSISPRGSDPVARLAPNTELIVEPWSASAARSAGAAGADDGLDLDDLLKTLDDDKTSTILRFQSALSACADLLECRTRSVAYAATGSFERFEQEVDVCQSTVAMVDAETAREHKIRHGSFIRAFKHCPERELDFTRSDDDVPSLFLRVTVVESTDVVAREHVALSGMTALALELFQGDLVRIKEVETRDLSQPKTLTVRLRPLVPPLPMENLEDDIGDLFTTKRSVLHVGKRMGPTYAVVLGLNAPSIDVDAEAGADFYDARARSLFTSWLREQTQADSEDEAHRERVIVNAKTRLVFKITEMPETLAVFEMELKYPASARVENPEKPVWVSLSDVSAATNSASKMRVELGAPIRLPRSTPSRNPAPGVTVWPKLPFGDDEFAHIPGEELREHTDETLKLLKTSLRFDAIELREEYGVGMCPGTLVTGAKGRGRSRLVKSLCRDLAEDVKAVSGVVEIRCDQLPKPELKTLEALRAGFAAAESRRPAICYLLNLEEICGEKEDESDGVYHLSCLVAEEMEELADNDAVTFMATTSEREALSKPLRDPQVFDYEFEVKKPSMDARRDVLLSYARYRGVELSEDIADSFSQKTDGYDVVDLRTILESAIASASRREDGNVDALRLLSMDLHKGMDGYVPVDQATLVKSSGRGGEGIDNYVDGFDSIGGYDDIKTILDDAIALPARHPKIFAQCPLRLPSGVLLYGAPGVGKSALAKAAIVNAGLRSITIRGPELLSKYYGESEASLRELFRRAEAAAPCALFFDEFDSLAPKRGGTDGGVTDRMVNQFLTLLDGVDSLKGVFVIAATSRPDVIDPALLRPGRLDHVLYMPMPDADERAEIVRCLLRDEKLADDVDLITMARDMENFTGADLASFVAECGNSASRRILKQFDDAKARGEDLAAPTERPRIEKTDVDWALTFSRPSLAKETRDAYNRSHAAFLANRSSKASSSTVASGNEQTYAGR